MKDALKIVFTLTLVVVISSVAVFFVEGFTSEEIFTRQQAEIAEALNAVIPGYEENEYSGEVFTPDDVDFGDSGIIEAYEVSDTGGNPIGYAYIGEFRGYASTIRYIIGVDFVGTITGYQILEQGDTPTFGAQIGIPENWEQFTGMLFKDAGAGSFDGLAGATATTNAWIGSFEDLYEYHKDTYGEPTPEQLLNLKKAALVPDGLTITSYTPTEDMAIRGITAVDVASDGTTNQAVVYTVGFEGYSGAANEYLVSFDLTNNNVISYVHLSSGDTEEYGGQIMNTTYWASFTDKTIDELVNGEIDTIAGTSGAPITTGALSESLLQVAIFHSNEFTENKLYSKAELFELYKTELFPTATSIVDVTEEKPGDAQVATIFEAYDGDTYLGSIYHMISLGSSTDGFTFIQYLVGIDVANNFVDVKVFDFGDVSENVTAYDEDTFVTGIAGVDVESAFVFNAITNAPNTSDSISDGLGHVAFYHINEASSRPASMDADDADLLLAFPGAISFLSVYEDYDYQVGVGNVYEAQDALGDALGYVYVASYKGYSDETIVFAIGVDLTGTTTQIHIISGDQSWSMANDFSDYSGSAGLDFQTSSWLDNFEGATVADLVATPIDGVAGVSTTTGGSATNPMGLVDVIDIIVNYHTDQSVGGAE